jgi:hypothetical protein
MSRDRTRILIARCDTYNEALNQPCSGTLHYTWGQIEAACTTCLGRCGISVATWERVEHR